MEECLFLNSWSPLNLLTYYPTQGRAQVTRITRVRSGTITEAKRPGSCASYTQGRKKKKKSTHVCNLGQCSAQGKDTGCPGRRWRCLGSRCRSCTSRSRCTRWTGPARVPCQLGKSTWTSRADFRKLPRSRRPPVEDIRWHLSIIFENTINPSLFNNNSKPGSFSILRRLFSSQISHKVKLKTPKQFFHLWCDTPIDFKIRNFN